MLTYTARWFIGSFHGRCDCTFSHPSINSTSIVLISASEGLDDNSTAAPGRLSGDALVSVYNIAPFGFIDPQGSPERPKDGGVNFVIYVDFSRDLNIWADILVFEPPMDYYVSQK